MAGGVVTTLDDRLAAAIDELDKSVTEVAQLAQELANEAEKLANDALFGEGSTVLPPMAEQHFLLAIAALNQAQAHFKLANYHLIRKD